MQEEFTNDDYETPDWLAKKMCSLVLPTDKYILEPFAGSGQIVKYLPSDRAIDVVEIKPSRYLQLIQLKNHCFTYNGSFFEFQHGGTYDLIITNPPFSLCIEAISYALTFLNPDNPDARLLFLMPLAWNCPIKRSEQWEELNAHIHYVHRIRGRVDYLENGVPCKKLQQFKDGKPVFKKNGKPQLRSGRSHDDAVFDIRLGKENAVTTFLN
jgi:hypothetical protein